MHTLSLEIADQIAAATIQEGRDRGFAPLTVAIMDPGGHLITLKRDNKSSIMRPQIAQAKAWGALSMGFGGRELARRAANTPAFFNALSVISDGRMAPVPGGALIRNAEGDLLGAIGVTGDTSDNDELAFLPAIKQAGLVAETGDPN